MVMVVPVHFSISVITVGIFVVNVTLALDQWEDPKEKEEREIMLDAKHVMEKAYIKKCNCSAEMFQVSNV